ncbi:MAG: ASKHA domain-containing protein [Deltaproteobacteria bacterium]
MSPDRKKNIGVAIDLGTTSIACAAMDLDDGKPIGRQVRPNPQSVWGADVVARMSALKADPELLLVMSERTVGVCNEMIRSLASPSDVDEIVVAGNPVMQAILLRVSPLSLARPPYRPPFKEAQRVQADEFGFNTRRGAGLYVFPQIGGFVGGDAVAVALSLHMGKHHNAHSAVITIDIGTNSEVILATGGKLFAASAAAGPAFEAAGVRCGMTARPGAIQGVRIEGDRVALDVLSNVAPKGICGSGLVDAVAVLLDRGVIAPSGRIKDKDEIPDNLSGRIKRDGEANAFVLHRGASGEVCLFQEDIRALQNAKAAIRASISLLMQKAKISAAHIERIYIAGAFGSNLKSASLSKVGIIDSLWQGITYPAGNAVIAGAMMALGSDEAKKEAEELSARTRFVALSGSAQFEREFISNMVF